MPLPDAFSGPGPPPDPGGGEASPWSPVSVGHVTPESQDNLAVDLPSSARATQSRIPLRTHRRSEASYSRNSSKTVFICEIYLNFICNHKSQM